MAALSATFAAGLTVSAPALLRRACNSASWRFLSRPTQSTRPARLHSSAGAAVAALAAGTPPVPTPAPTPPQQPEVEPPPTVTLTAEALNSVAVSGTVLTDPQVYYLPANQVVAHVRLGLRPRNHWAALPQQRYGAATVDCFGALALQLSQHVRKGSRIQVRGMLKEDSWSDKNTGEARRSLKIVAEELALLAPPAEHQGGAGEAEAGAPDELEPQQAAYEQHQHQQHQQQQQKAERQPTARGTPHYSPSAKVTRTLYEENGMSLQDIAAFRNIKVSTILTHLVDAGWAGALSNWQRLAGDVQLGPPGSASWLSPAEVAQAIMAAQAQQPEAGLAQLSLKAIRQELEAGPGTALKVGALLQAQGGDPALLYGAVRLVMAMLEQGVSFDLISQPPPPPPSPADAALGRRQRAQQQPGQAQGPPPF